MPSPTRQVFVQRGNYPTFAVQWSGEMDQNIDDFLRSRGVDEYWLPDSADKPMVIRSGIHFRVIHCGTWLVDQGGLEEELTPFRFVVCNNARFHLLYREVPAGEVA